MIVFMSAVIAASPVGRTYAKVRNGPAAAWPILPFSTG